MKKRGRFSARKRNKTNKWINSVIAVLFILIVGSIIWVGTNEWNVKKAVESLQSDSDGTAEFQEIEPGQEDDLQNNQDQKDSGTDTEGPVEEPLRKIKEPSSIPDHKEKTDSRAERDQPGKDHPTGYIEGQELPQEPKYVDGILLANKQYPLPKDFAPGESKEARQAFDEMAAEALLSGINLQAFSTYRAYDYQVTLYNRYVERDGQEAADRYSARPGYSEHQTGLAFDIGEVNHEKHWASPTFGDTEAGKWLAANAYKYGFILRYPKGKEDVTGYMHESWHYRYVGKKEAEEIFKRNITLEEYLGIR